MKIRIHRCQLCQKVHSLFYVKLPTPIEFQGNKFGGKIQIPQEFRI